MFSSNQSGVQRLHSALKCLLKNSDDWYSRLDLGKLVGLVFIDLKRAFDTVSHDIICQKLKYYGIQQHEVLWFQSYLSNREQFCRVNEIDPEIKCINIGIPQGSCLGPLLFIIYFNDLPQAVNKRIPRPGKKEKEEAPCERSKRKLFRVWKATILLFYFMRPPLTFNHWVFRGPLDLEALGHFASPAPFSVALVTTKISTCKLYCHVAIFNIIAHQFSLFPLN